MLLFTNVLNRFISLLITIFLSTSSFGFAADNAPAKKILFVRNQSIWAYDVNSKKESEFIRDADNPACSADGMQVAFTRNHNVWVANLSDGKVKRLTYFKKSQKGEIRNIDWSLLNHILFERDQLVDLTLKSRYPVVWPDKEFTHAKQSLSLSAIWLIKAGEPPKQFIGYTGYGSGTIGTHLSQVEAASWSPDGKKIAFSRNGDIWLAEFDSFEDKVEHRILPIAHLENANNLSPSSTGVRKIAWSESGGKLVFSVSRLYGSGVGELWLVDSDGTNPRQLSAKGYEQSPIFLDENVIAYSDGYNVRTINIDSNTDRELIHNATKPRLCGK